MSVLTPLRLLLVEESETDAELVLHELRRAGYAPVGPRVETEADFLAQLDVTWDLIVSDYHLPEFTALHALAHVTDRQLDVPVIVVSSAVGEEVAVQAIQLGAVNYLRKNRLECLGDAARQAIEQHQLGQGRRAAAVAVRQSGEHLALALAAAGMVTWDWRVSTGQLHWSTQGIPGQSSAGEGTATESSYEAFLRTVHPDDRELVEALDEHCVSSAGYLNYGYRTFREGQPVLWWETRGRAVEWDPSGRAARVVGVTLDVTARKQEEEHLRQSEARLRLALAAASMATWELDLRTAEVTGSEGLAALIGLAAGTTRYSYAESLDRVHPEDRARMLEADRKAIEEGETYEVEARVMLPDGSIRWIAERGEVVERDRDGRAVRMMGVTKDVTDAKRAEDLLRQNEARLAEAQRLAQLGSWEWSVADNAVTWSSELYRIFGRSPDTAVRSFEDFLEHVHPDDRARVRDAVTEALANRAPFEYESRIVRDDGTIGMIHARGQVVQGEGGEVVRMQGTAQDISARKLIEETLATERAFAWAVLDAVEDGIVACNAQGETTLFNRAMRELHGIPDGTLGSEEWVTPYGFYHADGVTPLRADEVPLSRALRDGVVRNVEMVIAHVNGERRTVVASGRALHDPKGRRFGAVVGMHDITDRKVLENHLRHQAFHDILTGLPNRALVHDRLTHALERARRLNTHVAVLFLDLDNFKVVNDSIGHSSGDELLVKVASRLQLAMRAGDTIGRLGGDEFICMLEDLSDLAEAAEVATRIADRLRHPITIADRDIVVTTSIGIAVSAVPVESAEDLLRHADQAMYAAKRAGKAVTVVFDPAMDSLVIGRLELESELRNAIDTGELRLAYQPIFDLNTGNVIGAEALVRWHHPTRGVITPGEFIPIAEETELIFSLGRWVLTEACRQAAVWQTLAGGTGLPVSVNLSARQVGRLELVSDVADALARAALPASRLILEITERLALADDRDTEHTLRTLKHMGVGLAIDDFGTGFSGLSSLRGSLVDSLKIDQVFVAGLGRDPRDTGIVQAVLALARVAGLSTTAEGIETPAQADTLRALGCNHGQGHLFARPMSPDELEVAFLRDRQAGTGFELGPDLKRARVRI